MINFGTLFATLKLRDMMTPALAQASRSLSAAGAKLKTIGAGMKSAGTSLSTGLTLPLVAMGAAAGIAFGSFEKNMNKVKALTGETGKAFDDMSGLARELGATTKFSASEAADAMGFLAMAGFKTDEIMGSLPGVLELAASANLGLADAADITTNILTGYGRTVEQVAETNDILVKAFTSANTDLTQLGQAFKFVGPVAKSAGVSFEEATASLALMGNAGIQASMAGTSLRGAITKLLNPTNKAAKVMRDVGVVAKDSSGNLLPMADIVQQLGDRAVSTGDMMTIFGLRAGPAMAGLVSQGHESIRKLTDELGKAGGIASRVATIQMEGLNGTFIRFKSASEGAFIALGEKLSPALIGLFEAGIKAANWIENKLVPAFASLNPVTQKIIIGLIAFTAALGPLLIILGQMAIGVGALMLAFGGLGTTAAINAAPKIGILTRVMALLNKSFLARGIKVFFAPALKALGIAATATGGMLKRLIAQIAATTAAQKIASVATVAYTTVKKILMATIGGGKAVILRFIGFLGAMVTAQGLGTAASGMLTASLYALWTATGVGLIVVAAIATAFALWKFVKWVMGIDAVKDSIVKLKGWLGFLSDAEVEAQLSTHKLNEELEDVTPTAQTLREALFEAGKTVEGLELAMTNLADVTGGLADDEMEMIAQKAIALREAGEDLSPNLERVVKLFEDEQLAAKKAADELENQRQQSDELAQAVEELRSELSGDGLLGELEVLERAWSTLTPQQQANEDTMRRAGEAAANLADEGVILTGRLKELAKEAANAEEAIDKMATAEDRARDRAKALANRLAGNLTRDVMDLENAYAELAYSGRLTEQNLLDIGKAAVSLEAKGATLTEGQKELAAAFTRTERESKKVYDSHVDLFQTVSDLADEFSDSGLAGEVVNVEAAYQKLKREGKLNESTLKAVGKAAQDLKDRGGELSDELLNVAASAGEMNDNLGQSPGFLGSIKASGKSLLEGITGGKGMSGFFSNLGTGIVDGLGSILSGGISSIIGMGVNLAMKGVAKIGSAIAGLFGRSTEENMRITAQRMWGIVLTGTAAKAAADMSVQVGDDFAALLMTLGTVIETGGGVMALGFSNVARAARDTFSAIDMGKLDAEQALTGLLPVLEMMAVEFENADAAGQAAFLELIQLAQEFGLDMDAIVQVVGQDLVDQALGNDLPGVLTTLKDSLGSVTSEGLEPLLNQLIGLGVLTDEQKIKFMEMAGQSVFDTQRAQEAAERYGIALEDLGPKFQAAKLGERALQISEDFAILAASGMPVEDIIRAQGDAVHALVRDSRWAGTEIPDSMRPVIEAMIEQGSLTDENGEKITDMAQLDFAKPIEEKLADVMTSLGELIQKFIDALNPINDLTTNIQNIPDANVDVRINVPEIPRISIPRIEVDVGYDYDEYNPPGRHSYAHGTHGRFVDFGGGTPAILHGRERITPIGEAGDGDGMAQIEGRLVSIERLLKDQPRAFGLAISDSLSLIN